MKDKIAKETFGVGYNSLSIWAQQWVDKQSNVVDLPTVDTGATLERKVTELQDQLKQAKRENLDLWEENQALKLNEF